MEIAIIFFISIFSFFLFAIGRRVIIMRKKFRKDKGVEGNDHFK